MGCGGVSRCGGCTIVQPPHLLSKQSMRPHSAMRGGENGRRGEGGSPYSASLMAPERGESAAGVMGGCDSYGSAANDDR
jgi:hypothetical protein